MKNMLVSTGFAVLRGIEDKCATEFLYYFLTQKQVVQHLQTIAEHSTTAYPSIRPSDIESLNIEIPPLPEQKAIAYVLGALDDKIEVNRKMNETLEEMARAIFKSWFVDFDPVIDNALSAGNPIPDELKERAAIRKNLGNARKPLPDDIRSLFPDSFEPSPIGQIPKGWKVKPVGDAMKCVGGTTPKTKEPLYWNGGTNSFVTPKDMSSLSSPVILETERHITNAGVEKISSGILPLGTLLLSSRAPIGYLAVAEIPVSINQGIIAMICNGDLPIHYALYWTEANMEVIKSKAGGTTFAEISKSNFRSISTIIPMENVLNIFSNQVEALHQRIVMSVKESLKLAALRDTLLPKLISGELRIPDVEKLLSEAEK
jgi:type I restriction enzyme S subunit